MGWTLCKVRIVRRMLNMGRVGRWWAAYSTTTTADSRGQIACAVIWGPINVFAMLDIKWPFSFSFYKFSFFFQGPIGVNMNFLKLGGAWQHFL